MYAIESGPYPSTRTTSPWSQPCENKKPVVLLTQNDRPQIRDAPWGRQKRYSVVKLKVPTKG